MKLEGAVEQWELYLHIGRLKRSRQRELLFRWPGAKGMEELSLLTSRVGERAEARPQPEVGEVRKLVQLFLRGHYLPQRPSAPDVVLLDIDEHADDLFSIDWEQLLRAPPLPTKWQITRYVERSDPWVGIPVDLPAWLLRAGTGSSRLDFRSSSAEKSYFRLLRLTNVSDEDLLRTLAGGRFDVVHLGGMAIHTSTSGSADIALTLHGELGAGQGGIGVAELGRCLAAAQTRLLVLQVQGDDDYPYLLDFAHRLLHSGGPATVVFQGLRVASADAFYREIVHDRSLRDAARLAVGARGGYAIFCGPGGFHSMSLEPNQLRIARGSRRMSELLEEVQRDLTFERFVTPKSAAVFELKRRVDETSRRTYDASRESGAWVPLAEEGLQFESLRDAVHAAHLRNARVFNVGLVEDPASLQSLPEVAPGMHCWLAVNVSRTAGWSQVHEPVDFPESEVPDYPGGQVDLRVVVTARDFELGATEEKLTLPPPPLPSPLVLIRLRTPADLRPRRMRVGLYHENNLLQSVLVRFEVQPPRATDQGTWSVQAEVEFALTESLANPAFLPSRTVNFLCNATEDGSHTFVVVGNGFKKDFDFGDGQMRAAVNEARKSLLEIAADRSGRSPRYRFDANNAGSLRQLEADLPQLAERGRSLFSSIVTAEDRAFKDQLLRALGSGAQIQVAATKSARYVFPWALVYDKPFTVGASSLCPEFVRAAQADASLHGWGCVQDGCPHWSDDSVVCPSGFWGFKHLLEQPLSVKTKAGPVGAGDTVTHLQAGPRGTQVPVLMAVSRELDQVGVHVNEMKFQAGWDVAVKETKADILVNLQSASSVPVPLLYFYCHGGRSGANTWLGVGKGERLVPSDLESRNIDWGAASPLLLINGCHTVDITPDDLLSFNQVLAWCRAAGVIGTEIDVPETLARDFAKGFFALMTSGDAVGVGEAIRRHRLSLLGRFNPLGLAYTPYCSASLHLIHQQ